MGKSELRTTIIKLQNGLSDDERQRFHFLLNDHAPRRWVECLTVTGTFNLIQSLFDQDKINDENFIFLINAFEQIGCQRAVDLLKGVKQRMQSSSLTDEVFEDQRERPSSTSAFLKRDTRIDLLKKNKSVKTNSNTKETFSTSSEQSDSFNYIRSDDNKTFIYIIVSILIAVGIIFAIFFGNFYLNTRLGRALKSRCAFQNPQQENTAIAQTKGLSSEPCIMKEEKIGYSTSLFKFGPIHGLPSKDGFPFDHSSMKGFTYFHFLTEIRFRENFDGSESYVFSYSKFSAKRSLLDARMIGISNFSRITKGQVNENERIEKVEGQFIEENSNHSNVTSSNTSKLRGIQFHTTDNRVLKSLKGLNGTTFSESYKGYTLGYIVGTTIEEYVNQIQFIWYKTD